MLGHEAGAERLGRAGLGLLAAGVTAAFSGLIAVRSDPATPLLLCFGVCVAAALAFLVWRADPVWTLGAAVLLAPFSAHWQRLGLPGALALDRLLLAAGIGTVLVRAPGARRCRPPRPQLAHWLLAAAAAYGLISALASRTLLNRDAFFGLLESYGILPFLLFLIAPVVFDSPRRRSILLAVLLALGAYLGATAIFELAGPHALVFPRYILDPSYGIHWGRARGPFVEAVTNGVALYGCAVAACIALATWTGRAARTAALAVLALCTVGGFLTLQRSIWLGAVVATVPVFALVRGLRRYLVPVLFAAAAGIAAVLLLIPGLSATVRARTNEQDSVWDRQNLNTAALGMISARPLLGVGWNRFRTRSSAYFRQSPDYPLTATDSPVHNIFLSNAAELGLVGVALWGSGILLGVGGAIFARPPPELRAWRIGLLAFAIFFVVVMNFVPEQNIATLMLWLLAGVVWRGKRDAGRAPAEAG